MKNKRIQYSFALWMLTAVCALVSCSDDDDTSSYGPLSVDRSEIILTQNVAATDTLLLTSSSDWKAESSAQWLLFSTGQTAYGTPCRQLPLCIYASENTADTDRTAVITLTDLTGTAAPLRLQVTQAGHRPFAYSDENSAAPAGMKLNASGLMKQIVTGWNMGNTMESNGADETSWGNPMTTRATVDALHEQGFNAIRIPVRWTPRADDELNVSPAWMSRVKEVVDYAYTQGMYVILNSHHDTFYDRIVPGTLSETKESVLQRFSHLWTQIAETFKEYDEHLLFAGTNEVIYISQGAEVWDEPTNEELFTYMNELNQTFVNAVRATSGNNAWRTLVVQPWSANPDFALRHFVKPDDTVEGRLMLEFHYYRPWNFCQQSGDDAQGGNMYYWGRPYAHLPYATDTEAEVTSLFDQLKYRFVDQGLPVVMGEYGAVMHRKTEGNRSLGINFTQSEASRAYYLEFVVRQAKEHGFAAFFWDNNCIGTEGENFGLLNRLQGMTPYSPDAVEAIMRGARAGSYPY